MRLVGGSGPHEGRLEVNYQGIWGTVCSENSGSRYATGSAEWSKLVCRQLGFENGDSYETSSLVFDQGTGWVWKSVYFCTGQEKFPCIFEAVGHEMSGESDSCDHTNDIGLICNGKLFKASQLHALCQ